MKGTKRSLLASMAVLAASLLLLAGVTFAWFTSVVTNSGNTIAAGELKVTLHQLVDGRYVDTESKEYEGPAFNYDRWEPGYTAVEGFRIGNGGSLALKYRLDVSETENVSGVVGADVAKVIEVYYAPLEEEATELPASVGDMEYIGTLREVLDSSEGAAKGTLSAKEADYAAIALKMTETAGNEYMNASVKFDIRLSATQAPEESDGFGNSDYDEDAQYPDVAYISVAAPTEEDLEAGLNPLAEAIITASGEKTKIFAVMDVGTYKLTDKEDDVRNAMKGKEITLSGMGAEKTIYEVKKDNVTGEAAADYSFDGAKSVVFRDMTVEFKPNTDYQGFVRAGALRFENCTIKGMGANWGNGDVIFNNCKFMFADESNEWTNSLWTYGGNSFTFNTCTFISENGKFINVYRQGSPDAVIDVTLNNCKFINRGEANKAAVNIKSQCAWNVTINSCTVEGDFPEANGGLWQSASDFGSPHPGNKVTVNP